MALFIAGWLLVVDRGCGCAPAPNAALNASALRYFERSFHIEATALRYHASCKQTSFANGTSYVACPITRGGRTTREITTVYGTHRRLGGSQNFVDTFSFVPN